MKPFILFSYYLTFILAFLTLILFLTILRIKKKSAGKILAQWSSIYNLSTPLSWIAISFIFLYFLWCLYQIIQDPRASDGHHRLMFLIIFLSTSPLGNIYLGSEGIILGMRFIPWKKIKEKKIILKGRRRYLEIKKPSASSSKLKIYKIHLPRKVMIDNL